MDSSGSATKMISASQTRQTLRKQVSVSREVALSRVITGKSKTSGGAVVLAHVRMYEDGGGGCVCVSAAACCTRYTVQYRPAT